MEERNRERVQLDLIADKTVRLCAKLYTMAERVACKSPARKIRSTVLIIMPDIEGPPLFRRFHVVRPRRDVYSYELPRRKCK